MNIFENEDFTITESDDIKLSFNKGKFDKSFSQFLKQYPELSSAAIKIGSDSIAAYKSVKNMTARLFARTPMEKKIYGDIASILTNSGKFKLITKKVKDGGIFYELVRK